MTERFLTSDPPTDRQCKQVGEYVETLLQEREAQLKAFSTDVVVYAGGELGYLSALHWRFGTYPYSVTHPYKISASDYDDLDEWLRRLTRDELRSFMPHSPEWMDTAIACNIIARCLLRRLGAKIVVPSDRDVIDGVVAESARASTKGT